MGLNLQEGFSEGRCCGAPPEPIATVRFADDHRTGRSFGGTSPCNRASACEALDRRLRRTDGATLVDAREPRINIGRVGGWR